MLRSAVQERKQRLSRKSLRRQSSHTLGKIVLKFRNLNDKILPIADFTLDYGKFCIVHCWYKCLALYLCFLMILYLPVNFTTVAFKRLFISLVIDLWLICRHRRKHQTFTERANKFGIKFNPPLCMYYSCSPMYVWTVAYNVSCLLIRRKKNYRRKHKFNLCLVIGQ